MPHNTHGMNWITLHKRMAIYHRDHYDCVWCRLVFPVCQLGYGLTLDHVDGSSNRADNLVTSCRRCNSTRQDLGFYAWLSVAAKRAGMRRGALESRVRRQTTLPLVTTQQAMALARTRKPNYRRKGQT